MTRTCAVCQQSFKPPRPESIYCSRACYGASRRGKPSPNAQRRQKKICPVCQQEFETGGRAGKPNKLYCSRECAAAARTQRARCLECGAPCGRGAARKYCSGECYRAAQSRTVSERICEFVCATCGKTFERYVSERRGTATYCSQECLFEGRTYPRGADNPNWKGGTYISHGYEYRVDPARIRLRTGAFRKRATHLIVAEQLLGRSLEKDEHVHHRNGDRLDNRPENLLVLTASKHRLLHDFYAKSFQREHDEAGDLAELTEAFLASLS